MILAKSDTQDSSSSAGGYIFEIQKLSTEDGPGIRTTVFFKECPLRCAWCHNPESIEKEPSIQWFKNKCIGCNSCVEICPENAIVLDDQGIHIDREKCKTCGDCVEECPSTALKMFGEYWTVEKLFKVLAKDKAYYDKSKGGITISGGEPTLQADFLLALLKKCKDNGISTALDTCGLSSQAIYSKLIPYVDLFLLDIKEIDSQKHKEFVAHPNEKILENIKWLANQLHEKGKELWIRTPIIPRYTATKENILGIANFIVEKLDNKITCWEILAFNNLASAKYRRMDMEWDLKEDPIFTADEMDFFLNIAINAGAKNVKWSGLTRKE